MSDSDSDSDSGLKKIDSDSNSSSDSDLQYLFPICQRCIMPGCIYCASRNKCLVNVPTVYSTVHLYSTQTPRRDIYQFVRSRSTASTRPVFIDDRASLTIYFRAENSRSTLTCVTGRAVRVHAAGCS